MIRLVLIAAITWQALSCAEYMGYLRGRGRHDALTADCAALVVQRLQPRTPV